MQLENMGLGGDIDLEALSPLSELRTLSLMSNKFGGTFPDLRRLPESRSIYLSNNDFSGNIANDAFVGMVALRRMFLANNAFTGKIPSSLATLPILEELRLEGNQYQGSIPNFQQKEFPTINMANNQLEGPLPSSLHNLDPKSLAGTTIFLCFLFPLKCNTAHPKQLYVTVVIKEESCKTDFCTVYVISKSKISSVRNASRPVPYTSPLQSHLESLVKDKPSAAATANTPPRRSLSIKGLSIICKHLLQCFFQK